MAVTVVRGIATSTPNTESQPSQHHNSGVSNASALSQLVTRTAATDATVIQVKNAPRSADTQKLRDFSDANSKATELSERIREDSGAEDAHTEFEPVSAHRALSTNS